MPQEAALPANSALMPTDALRIGTRLEDYEIDCVIARSAVAMVYRALDRRNDQVVAIKEFLPIGLAMRGADGQVTARESIHEQKFQRGRQIFLEQARALEKCQHPSLMRVLRVMECYDTVCKAMPYCPEPTLLELRQKMAVAPTQRILRTWLEGLMGALAQFHENGQLHGAVSPGNILILPDARPVLLDSYAVHAAILSERTRGLIASLEPCFASQEQCEPADDKPLGPWTDLYALAATLRFGFSGQLPGAFVQGSRVAPVASCTRHPVNATAPTLADAPPWLRSLDACLAESGKGRPQSLAQLRDLLHVDGTGLPPRPARQFSIPLGRSPAKAALAIEHNILEPSPLMRQALSDDVQLPLLQQPLPPTLPSPAPRVAEVANPEGRTTTQPESGGSFSALATGEAAQPTSSGAQEPARSRFRIAGIAALLMLGATAATLISLLKGESSPGRDTTTAVTTAPLQPPPTQHAAATQIVPIAPRASVAPAEVPLTRKADAPASTLAAPPATPSPLRGKPTVEVDKGKPDSSARASSPRQACAGRERYALLQCMNEQCAKRTWNKHEQCVRLRKERKL